jgi:hypothetical protein
MQGLQAPFAQNDSFRGPGTDNELILQQQSATYLNKFLAEMIPVQTKAVYQHAHRIKNVPVHSFPQSNYRTDREPFLSPNAYTSRRARIKGNAPVQLQLSPGGLVIAGYQNVVNNINQGLSVLYKGASAPVSSNYSGKCK